MKKFICLLFVLILPFPCLMLTACGSKDKPLKEFYETYLNIADKSQYLKITQISDEYNLNINTYKVDIDYSSCPQLEDKIKSASSEYHYLESFYHSLLDNSLSPLYFYSPKIMESKNISKSQIKKLYSQLSSFENDLLNIAYYQGVLSSSIQSGSDENINLSHLNKLFLKYEDAINSASQLSSTISSIYFKKVVENPNPYFKENLNDSDIINIVTSTRTRLYYYKAMYADVYNQLYVRGANLGDKIIAGCTLPTYEPYEFISQLDQATMKPLNELKTNSSTIYTYATLLYNIQLEFDFYFEKYETAKNKITYTKINYTSSTLDQQYASIMKQFADNISYNSYTVLKELVNCLYITGGEIHG